MTESRAAGNDVPSVSSSGINNSAKMVWQAVQVAESFQKYSTRGKFQGIPGWYWQGAVNQVINDIWPALGDRYLTEKEQAEEIKLILNRFLRANRAMICTRDGGMVKRSTWFVAEHWPELTVTPGPPQDVVEESVVSDAAATESPTTVGKSAVAPSPLDVFSISRPAMAPAIAAAEERSEEATMSIPAPRDPMDESTSNDETPRHECRLDNCGESFLGVHHRATHEMKHGFRINVDGTVTNFDVNAPVPDEEQVQDLILKICEGQEPMNQAQIVEAVRKDTPKAGTPTIKIVLQILTDEGWFEVVNTMIESGMRGNTRRYKYLGKPLRKSSGTKTVKPIAQVVEETIDKMIGDNADQSRIERYRGLLEDLMADLDEIDKLKAQIQRMEKSNAVVVEQLRSTTEELIKVQMEGDKSEELARVTRERDELQGTLDTLKKVFGSALQ